MYNCILCSGEKYVGGLYIPRGEEAETLRRLHGELSGRLACSYALCKACFDKQDSDPDLIKRVEWNIKKNIKGADTMKLNQDDFVRYIENEFH